jgi:hypothetical protein
MANSLMSSCSRSVTVGLLTLLCWIPFSTLASAHAITNGVTVDHGERPGGGSEAAEEVLPPSPPPGLKKSVQSRGGSLKRKASGPATPP